MLKLFLTPTKVGGGGGVEVPLVTMSYDVTGGHAGVMITYAAVENNQLAKKVVDAPDGSSGTITFYPGAGLEITSNTYIDNSWGGMPNVVYPMVELSITDDIAEYYVGGDGQARDMIWLAVRKDDHDGKHLTITTV